MRTMRAIRKKMMQVAASALVAALVALVAAMPAHAASGPYSLSIVYLNPTNKSEAVSGVNTRIYRVAERDESFILATPFDSYAIAWPAADASSSEWDAVAKTIANYVAADGVDPLAEATSDEEGTARFEGLNTGLYLVVSDMLVVEDEHGSATYAYQAALVALPSSADAGYDEVAYPKGEFSREDNPEPQRHKVTKRWSDAGNTDRRPKSIKVEIYCDGELYASAELSDANNWVYEWEDDGASHTWSVVERDIAQGYTVTIDGTAITNTYPTPETPLSPTGPTPKTGQAWLPIPIFLIAGIVMLGLGRILWAFARRAETEKEAK